DARGGARPADRLGVRFGARIARLAQRQIGGQQSAARAGQGSRAERALRGRESAGAHRARRSDLGADPGRHEEGRGRLDVDRPAGVVLGMRTTGAVERVAKRLAGTVVLLIVGGGAALACDDGVPKIGYLGISDLRCSWSTNFSMRSRDGQRTIVREWEFRSEPIVRGVESDGPTAGKLHDEDVITAIDGALITTREGSRRFSAIAPDQAITLTVRREGHEAQVPIKVGGISPEEVGGGPFSVRTMIAPHSRVMPETPETPPRAPPAPPAPPSERAAPTPFVMRMDRMRGMMPPTPAPSALPSGWVGIGLNCTDCGAEDAGDGKGTMVWNFGSLPTISYVDPRG